MGLFDMFKKKDDNGTAAQSGTARTAGSGAVQSGGTPVDPAKQLHVKFGTKEPVPFVDAQTGLNIGLTAHGSAIVAVKDTAAFRSEEEAVAKAQEICKEELGNQIRNFSGQIDVSKYPKIIQEFKIASVQRLKECGLIGVTDLAGIHIAEESKKALAEAQEQLRMAQDPAYAEAKRVREEAEAMQEQMAAGRAMKSASSETVEPVKVASVDGSAMPVTGSTRPKFCPNCGTPSGTDKFCRNCGHAFGA